MNEIDINVSDKPEMLAMRSESTELSRRVSELQVRDDDSMREAVEIGQKIARWKRMITEIMRGPKRALDEAKRKVLDQERALMALVDGPDEALRSKIRQFERDREAERRRMAKEAEDEARRKADDEKLARAERLEALANATGDEALHKAAERELDAPSPVVIPATIQAQAPKIQGASFRTVVSVEVVSLRELARAVADGVVSEQAISANMPWLKGEARQRGAAYSIPGTVRTESRDVSIRV